MGLDLHCDDTATDCRPASRIFTWNRERGSNADGRALLNDWRHLG
jgi:hypothetical protein